MDIWKKIKHFRWENRNYFVTKMRLSHKYTTREILKKISDNRKGTPAKPFVASRSVNIPIDQIEENTKLKLIKLNCVKRIIYDFGEAKFIQIIDAKKDTSWLGDLLRKSEKTIKKLEKKNSPIVSFPKTKYSQTCKEIFGEKHTLFKCQEVEFYDYDIRGNSWLGDPSNISVEIKRLINDGWTYEMADMKDFETIC